MGMYGEGRSTSSPALRRLAIVGSHPATRELAPYDDERYEIWLFNESPMKPNVYKRWDAAVQLHKEIVYSSLTNWVNKDYWAWLQQEHGDKRIFMQDVDPRVPNSVKYPLDEALELVPLQFRHYVRSTPAYAIILAIYLGYKYIEVYGSELSSNTEYGYQASNMCFWVGFALGYGVHLEMRCWESEFNQPLYGFEGEYQIDKSYFEERFKEHELSTRINENTYNKLKDMLDDAMLKHEYKKVSELSFKLADAAQALGETQGARNEAKRYMGREDMISRQEFERISAGARLEGAKKEKDVYYKSGICEYVWNVWMQTGKIEPLNQLRKFMDERMKLSRETGEYLGICHENLMYLSKYDKGVIALGGKVAVNQVIGIEGVDTRPGKAEVSVPV